MVTAAAIIMISVFAGFILSPESIVKSIGFALGVAVRALYEVIAGQRPGHLLSSQASRPR